MFCRKCGARKTTKRAAGIFHCNHCGMLPGPLRMDRAGNPSIQAPEADPSAAGEYVFAGHEPRLRGAPRGNTNAEL